MNIKQQDLKPGMHVLDGTPWPAALDFDHLRLTSVTHHLNGTVIWANRVTGNGPDAPARHAGDREVTVPSAPPRVLMSWHEESQTWAILIDTTNGSGQSNLIVSLNDADLWEGPSDDPIDEPEPRLVSAGMMPPNVLGPGGHYYPRCPECGQPQTADHMAEAHGEKP